MLSPCYRDGTNWGRRLRSLSNNFTVTEHISYHFIQDAVQQQEVNHTQQHQKQPRTHPEHHEPLLPEDSPHDLRDVGLVRQDVLHPQLTGFAVYNAHEDHHDQAAQQAILVEQIGQDEGHRAHHVRGNGQPRREV